TPTATLWSLVGASPGTVRPGGPPAPTLLSRSKPSPPLSRARFKAAMRQAGRLDHLAPQVWPIPWNVHRQADPHGHAAFTSLAPYVFKVALANHRLVSLTDRIVTFTSRKVGSARLRTTHRDALAFIRRFLQPVLPEGFMKARHGGVLQASCALPLATIRRMIEPVHPGADQPPSRTPPPPHAVRWPTCGAPRRVVMRGWTSHRDVVDTGCAPERS